MNLPQPAIMSAALRMAEGEDTNLAQRHIQAISSIIEGFLCDEDDCYLPRGHDTDCLPVLQRFAADRVELAGALAAMLARYEGTDSLSETCAETLRVHGQD